MTIRRLQPFVIALILLASIVVPFVNPGQAVAAGEQYSWVNGLYRVSGGDLSGPSDLDFDRTENDVVNIFAGTLQHQSGCTINMEIESNIATQVIVTNVTGGSCSQQIRQSYDNLNISDDIDAPPVSGPRLDVTVRFWSPYANPEGGSAAIQILEPVEFDILSSGNKVYDGSANGTDVDTVIGDTVYTMTYYQATPFTISPTQRGSTYQLCPTSTTAIPCMTFTIPQNYASGQIIEINDQPDASDLEGIGDETRIGCPYSNPLNWVICPFVTGAMSAISGIDIAINNLLNIGTEQIFDDETQTGEAYRTAWGVFRTFALAFIVIAALVMVISQAAGLEVLDAYTIRKVLPRLLIAAIGITLSWELMEASVILFNDLGQGVRDIIRAPFDDAFREAAQLSVGSTFIILLLTTGAIFAYGLLAILSFAVTILIAVVVAYAMLVFREIVIIFLVISAPIFIALSVLPNTRRFSSFGFRTFFGLLLAYPIVMGTIAIGDVFSVVAASSEVGSVTGATQILSISTFSVSHAALASGTLAVGELFAQGNAGQIVGVVAFIASRAAIVPVIAYSFSMAGALGQAMGRFGSSAAQRLNAPVQGFRSRRLKTNMENVGKGERFRGTNRLTRGLNTAMQYGAAAPAAFESGVFRAAFRPREAINRVKSKVGETRRDQLAAANESSEFKEIQSDTAALTAGLASRDVGEITRLLVASGRAEAEARLDAVKVVRAQEAMGNNFEAAAVVAKAGTGDGYNDADGGGGHMVTDIVRAARGDRTMEAHLFNAAKNAAKGASRYDLTSSFGSFVEAREHVAGRRRGRGPVWTQQQITDHLADNALDVQGVQVVTAGRGDSARAFVPALQRRMDRAYEGLLDSHGALATAQAGGNAAQIAAAQQQVAAATRRYEQDVASSEALIDVASGASPQNARILADGFHATQVDLAALPPEMRDWLAARPDGSRITQGTISQRELMRHLTSRPAVHEMRRNYADMYQQQMGTAPMAGAPGAPAPVGGGPGGGTSDRRLKRDIINLGLHSSTGIPLYRFKYLWSEHEYIGVMAQDITESHPEAISIGTDGYYRVSYETLGIELRKCD